jgi:hypothetical protein
MSVNNRTARRCIAENGNSQTKCTWLACLQERRSTAALLFVYFLLGLGFPHVLFQISNQNLICISNTICMLRVPSYTLMVVWCDLAKSTSFEGSFPEHPVTPHTTYARWIRSACTAVQFQPKSEPAGVAVIIKDIQRETKLYTWRWPFGPKHVQLSLCWTKLCTTP